MRETDRESCLMGRWTGSGFVIVCLGALTALLLLRGLGEKEGSEPPNPRPGRSDSRRTSGPIADDDPVHIRRDGPYGCWRR